MNSDEINSIDRIVDLLSGEPIEVVNIGLERFADTLQASSVKVIHVDWRPPASGDQDLARMLNLLTRKDS